MPETGLDQEHPPITSLSKVQRRVLGVLIEKGFTTPDQYPLTLKAATTACNQKNNRDPLTNYDEPQVEQALDELRALGVAAVVHTETGRTERHRHWMRKRFPDLNEAQLAIMGELLLRGRQQVGELRARASRMKPIESLDELRHELETLLALKWIQSDGPLDRRGAEVDHNWYEPREDMSLRSRPVEREIEPATRDAPPRPASSTAAPAGVSPAASDVPRRLSQLEEQLAELRSAQRESQSELSQLRDTLASLTSTVESLRRDLGG